MTPTWLMPPLGITRSIMAPLSFQDACTYISGANPASRPGLPASNLELKQPWNETTLASELRPIGSTATSAEESGPNSPDPHGLSPANRSACSGELSTKNVASPKYVGFESVPAVEGGPLGRE